MNDFIKAKLVRLDDELLAPRMMLTGAMLLALFLSLAASMSLNPPRAGAWSGGWNGHSFREAPLTLHTGIRATADTLSGR